MNDTTTASFLENLRQATARSHKDLEDLPISASIINPDVTINEYAAYLRLMRDVTADTEENIFPLLEGIIPDLEQRGKAHYIDADLAVLGVQSATHSRPVTRNLKEISAGFALGIIYVVEGSSLGGRVILKNISSALGYDGENGASYFAGYGGKTGSYWKNFLSALSQYEAENQCASEIIKGANFTFDAINAHFRTNALNSSMKIKDIVNREIVNLTNCEQEPIHIPGSIQPHGFLLGLKYDSFTIDFCSENCVAFIGQTYSELLGNSFAAAFGDDALKHVKDYIANGQMLSSSLLKLQLNGNDFLCTVHNNGHIYILEAEPVSNEIREASEVYDQTSQFLTYMHDTHTLKELCGLVAKGTQEITGYDRVMIYRFDKDYNGEVFAESVREDLEPFLGLHYPHTDIPPQARELYMQNLLRLITDINYTPVPIFTVDDGDDKNLDLSLSILRSTSPMHVQYLHNMGVGATLTISLIYKKKLWGLIACHHYSAKNISPEIRLAAQLQGHFITSQIDVRQASEEYEEARKVNLSLEKMNTFSLGSSAALQEIADTQDILKLCNASGVSILFNEKVYTGGITPAADEIKQLANWLATYSSNGSFHTDKLVDYLPEMKSACEIASGIIYHSLDMDSNNCIIWYRPETITEVNWAGDPAKSIIKDKNGLSPRNSFSLWKEIVSCKSKPWLQPEIDTAAAYAFSLQRHISLLVISLEEEKYRKLSELLKQTNSELENINWISTHDLQEPLRKIQLISSRILSKEEDMPPSVHDSLTRMNSSAQRMQTLLIDILKYTKLRHTDDSFEIVDLNNLIENVRDDMTETIAERSTQIIVDNLPSVEGIPFLLRQLFSNLIANSIKYASPDRQPVIKITAAHDLMAYSPDDKIRYQVVYVADNGIGFDQQYAESIFNIFTKLHASSDYKGSGVGLALCRKIMQNHNGYITASSALDEGTVMSLYFPVHKI